MDLKQIFEGTGDLSNKARAFVEAAAVFFGELGKSGVDLKLEELDQVVKGGVDYDAPVMDAYKKTYRPITASEIVAANKAMSEAISGEKWAAGFMAAVQLVLLFKP